MATGVITKEVLLVSSPNCPDPLAPQQRIFLAVVTAQALLFPTDTSTKVADSGITGTKAPQHFRDPAEFIAQVVSAPAETFVIEVSEELTNGVGLTCRYPVCPAFESPWQVIAPVSSREHSVEPLAEMYAEDSAPVGIRVT